MNKRRDAAIRICKTLSDHGHRALLAGGCVRDMLLGKEPKDYDVATSATPDEIDALFERCVPVGAAFGVMKVVLPEGTFEVTTFRREGRYLDGRRPDYVEFTDEEEDARRRDFTVNGLFLDPATDKVVDYVGGREDLENKIIRAVGDPWERFQEDHLRLLRAVRIAAALDFQIDDNTWRALTELKHLIQKTSPERIREELLRMLTEGYARQAFELLDETGLLEEVLPEVARMKGVEQPVKYHPEGDVFRHTLLVLENLGQTTPTTALGALLHDIGKPLTQTFEDRIRFNQHEKVGARVAREICERLRLSNAQTERVVWLVNQHMRVAAAPKMKESKLKRLIRHEGFQDLLELFRVDCASSHGRMQTYRWLKHYAETLAPEHAEPPLFVTGHDLIEMGYKPGPLFSEILTAAEDAQLEGKIKSPEDGRRFVRDRWPLPEDATKDRP